MTTATTAALAYAREYESVYNWRGCLNECRDRHDGDAERTRFSFRNALKLGMQASWRAEARTAIEREAYIALAGAVEWDEIAGTLMRDFATVTVPADDDTDPERFQVW